MKSHILIMGSILIFLSGPIQGQDLMEQLKESTKQYDEKTAADGKALEEADPKKAAQVEKWKKDWEDTKEEYSADMDKFNTKELNCIFLMVLYVDAYQKLEQTAKNLKDCDLYGLQATAIALGTTIMYCPEHISKLSDEEFKDLYSQFKPLRFAKNKSDPLQNWFDKYERVTSRDWEGDMPGEKAPFAAGIDVLVGYFTPGYVVSATLNIGRIMEQLRCDER